VEPSVDNWGNAMHGLTVNGRAIPTALLADLVDSGGQRDEPAGLARRFLEDGDVFMRGLLPSRLNAVLDVAAGRETPRLTGLVMEALDRYFAGESLQHAVTRDMLAWVG